MATLYEKGDRIVLTSLDVRLLVRLLDGHNTAFALAKLCAEEESKSQAVSYGSISYSLKGMLTLGLVDVINGSMGGTKPQKLYSINPFGKDLLEAELKSMRQLIRTAEKHDPRFRLPI